MKNLRIPG